MATLHTSLGHGHHLPAAIARRPPRFPARGWCTAVPFSGLVRCAFSEKNGRLYCAQLSARSLVLRRTVDVSVQSSSSSSSQSTSQPPPENSWEGFNPDDYEQKEETEDEARHRNWVERGYAFPPFSIGQEFLDIMLSLHSSYHLRKFLMSPVLAST